MPGVVGFRYVCIRALIPMCGESAGIGWMKKQTSCQSDIKMDLQKVYVLEKERKMILLPNDWRVTG